MSRTRTSSVRPIAPPGWSLAKSSRPKPDARSSAIAIASPRASVAVVLAVGATPNGQASRGTAHGSTSCERRASVLSGLPVIARIGTPRRRTAGTRFFISSDSPE